MRVDVHEHIWTNSLLARLAERRTPPLSRGGPPIDLRDPLVFYETSSYGPAAVEMMAGRVDDSQLLYGSDRPVIEPTTTGRDARLKANAAALFASLAVAA